VNVHRFRPGDLVRVRHGTRLLEQHVWRVIADDTDRTPVPDPEPAYCLKLVGGKERIRYAYQSELVRTPQK